MGGINCQTPQFTRISSNTVPTTSPITSMVLFMIFARERYLFCCGLACVCFAIDFVLVVESYLYVLETFRFPEASPARPLERMHGEVRNEQALASLPVVGKAGLCDSQKARSKSEAPELRSASQRHDTLVVFSISDDEFSRRRSMRHRQSNVFCEGSHTIRRSAESAGYLGNSSSCCREERGEQETCS